MPICIECCYPVSELYHVLRSHKSAAPTQKPSHLSLVNAANFHKHPSSVPKATETKIKASGGDVRLTQCPRCKRFADKYVEHDFVVLFIDLVLVKPQVVVPKVYRHLLFNRLCRDDDDLDPSILRLGTLLLLFDVYLTWSHIEYIESLPESSISHSPISNLPVLLQYVFYLFFCITATMSQHFAVRWLASCWMAIGTHQGNQEDQEVPNSSPTCHSTAILTPPKKPTPNAISTALFVSSCMSLFPILMIVWKYDDAPDASNTASQSFSGSPNAPSIAGFSSNQGPGVDWVRRGVSWAVAVQNLEALRILLGCGYWSAGGLVTAGGAARWLVKHAILGSVGLGECV